MPIGLMSKKVTSGVVVKHKIIIIRDVSIILV